MFKPISSGMFGAMIVNKKLRELYNRIEALEVKAGTIEPEQSTPSIATNFDTEDPSETVSLEPVFDWRTTEDLDALKAWALTELNLNIAPQTKNIESARAKIEGFIREV